MIRHAIEADIPRLLEMGQHFFDATIYNTITDFDKESLNATFEQLLNNLNAVVLVVEIESQVVGMIVLFVFPCYFNHQHTTAQELLWWVEPEYRKQVGKDLLHRAQEEVKNKGAKSLVMLSLDSLEPQKIDAIYKREGFMPSEHTYIKRI